MEYGALTLLYPVCSSSVTLTYIAGGPNSEHHTQFAVLDRCRRFDPTEIPLRFL